MDQTGIDGIEIDGLDEPGTTDRNQEHPRGDNDTPTVGRIPRVTPFHVGTVESISRDDKPGTESATGIDADTDADTGEWIGPKPTFRSVNESRKSERPSVVNIESGTDNGTESYTDSTGTRRRGRPPGSKNKATVQNNLNNDVRSLLVSAHWLMGVMLKSPEWELSDNEAERMTRALDNVAQHYPIGIDPKKMAIAELMLCAGSVYGPRIIGSFVKRKTTTPEPKPTPVVINEPRVNRPAQTATPANPPQLDRESMEFIKRNGTDSVFHAMQGAE